jgi:protein SCO1/2
MTRAAAIKVIASAFAAICLAAALAMLVVSLRAPGALEDSADLAFRPNPGGRLPLATRLIDEAGQPISLKDFFTRSPVFVVLEYLQCQSLCGVTLRNLIETLNDTPLRSGRDYQLVAISIDPRDTAVQAAQARAKYSKLLTRENEVGGVHFVTGPADAVRGIAEAVGFPYRYDAELRAYIHPAGFVIASPDGIISRYIEGVAASPDQLVTAVADAQQDRSQGVLARIVLLCHVQGAPLGRLTVPVLATFTIANLAAGITLLAHFVALRRRNG